jgi:hypothetical protein
MSAKSKLRGDRLQRAPKLPSFAETAPVRLRRDARASGRGRGVLAGHERNRLLTTVWKNPVGIERKMHSIRQARKSVGHEEHCLPT